MLWSGTEVIAAKQLPSCLALRDVFTVGTETNVSEVEIGSETQYVCCFECYMYHTVEKNHVKARKLQPT